MPLCFPKGVRGQKFLVFGRRAHVARGGGVDTTGSGSLPWKCATIMRFRLVIAALPLLAIPACSPSGGSGSTDSMTVGQARMVAADAAHRLAAREVESFQTRYPKARIQLDYASTREALARLFANQADAVLIPRELTAEEDSIGQANDLRLKGFRIALDAVAVVVHPGNSVNQLSLDQIRSICSGVVGSWERFGGPGGGIRVLWREPNAASHEYLRERIMGGMNPTAVASWVQSDSLLVAEVARRPDAIGFVSMQSVRPGVKVLGVSEVLGLPYHLPGPESLWSQEYPLRHYEVMIYRASAPRVVEGLAEFALSNDGQALVQGVGLVPTAVPVRFKRQ